MENKESMQTNGSDINQSTEDDFSLKQFYKKMFAGIAVIATACVSLYGVGDLTGMRDAAQKERQEQGYDCFAYMGMVGCKPVNGTKEPAVQQLGGNLITK